MIKLANYTLFEKFLDFGFISVDYQMVSTGNTVLMLTILEDIDSSSSFCMKTEKDRFIIIGSLISATSEKK